MPREMNSVILFTLSRSMLKLSYSNSDSFRKSISPQLVLFDGL
jgi:hypothetical protein